MSTPIFVSHLLKPVADAEQLGSFKLTDPADPQAYPRRSSGMTTSAPPRFLPSRWAYAYLPSSLLRRVLPHPSRLPGLSTVYSYPALPSSRDSSRLSHPRPHPLSTRGAGHPINEFLLIDTPASPLHRSAPRDPQSNQRPATSRRLSSMPCLDAPAVEGSAFMLPTLHQPCTPLSPPLNPPPTSM